MAFSTPQAQDSPTFPAQALTDATDIAAVQAAGAGSVASGVVSGCAVTPNSSGVNLNVNVASGSVIVAGATVAVSAQTNITVSAASTHDRRDIVTVNSSGTASVTAGTPCSVAGWTTGSGVLGPVKPAIPASSVLIAEVYVPGAATSITASNLVAKAAPTGTSGVIAKRYLNKPAGSLSLTSSTIGAFSTAWQITNVVVASGQNVSMRAVAQALGTADFILAIYRGSTLLASNIISNSSGKNVPVVVEWIDENPGAGTYTYEVRGAVFSAGSLSVYAANVTTDANGGNSIFTADVYNP